MYQRNIGVGLNVAFLAIALQCFPFCEPSLQNKIQPDAKLILVQVVFRHGDRTPCWFYKKDRYQPKDFPEGKCRLINRGKERLFKSGQVFRERYHQYLGKSMLFHITHYEITVRYLQSPSSHAKCTPRVLLQLGACLVWRHGWQASSRRLDRMSGRSQLPWPKCGNQLQLELSPSRVLGN